MQRIARNTATRTHDAPHGAMGVGPVSFDLEPAEATMAAISARLTIPGKAYGANQVSGKHWRRYETFRKQAQRDTRLVWLEAGSPTFRHAIVRPRITFGSPARRDAANYYGSGTLKWVTDSLVQCGAFPDDTVEYVTQTVPVIVYKKGCWEIELILEEREAT